MDIRAIIFDFRDTIIDVKPAFKARELAVFRFLEKEGHKISRTTASSNLIKAVVLMKKEVSGTAKVYDFDFLLREFLKIGKITLKEKSFEVLHRSYMSAFYKNIKLYKESIKTLQFLSDSGYKLGLVIDGSPEVETNIIRRLDLARFFDSIVISEQLGHGKITGIPLKKCIEDLKISPSHIMVIGDRMDKDIRPANRLGAIPVRLIREKGRYSEQRPISRLDRPKFTISNLSELKKLL
jgi:HAD superfamily hydrolase (TIGR01549 family)